MRALLLLFLLALSSCARQDEKGLRLEFWTMQLKPTFEAYVTDLLGRWEKTHPGVRIHWVDLPASAIEDKILTAAASGQAPDLINLNPSFASKLAQADALLPLPVTPALKAAYFDAAWQANTFDGRILGLPWYLSTSVTFYNRALWKQAGLAPGHWPDTYAQLAAASRAIKLKTPAYGFLPNFGDRGKFMEILAQEGVPLLSADKRHAAFDSPRGISVLAFWQGLFQKGIVPQDAITQDHREAIDRFQAGQTAAFPAGPQFLNLIRQNAPALYAQLDVGPQITGAGGHIGIGVMNLVMLKSCPHQALAFDLAKFVTNGPNQLAFCKLVPILPSIKAAAANPYFKLGLRPGADLEARARAISALQLQRATVLVPPLPHQSDLAKSLDDALQRAALGTMSPADSLHEAAREWNALLAS